MYIADCKFCQDSLSSHPREPIVTKPRPSRPFQEVAIDFAYYGGQHFLVVVDCLTDWPNVFPMGRDLFSRTAAPDVVWSDGGPQLTSIILTHQHQESSSISRIGRRLTRLERRGAGVGGGPWCCCTGGTSAGTAGA